MTTADFNQMILRKKKERVKELVYKACAIEKVKVPKINFEGCPQETQDQLAHYHPNLHKICISETQLYKLNQEDIEETVFHELAHIFEFEHGSAHESVKNKLRHESWYPEHGSMYVTSDSIQAKESGKPLKISKKVCNYPKCRKRKGLVRCTFCHRYYCEEHAEPLISTTPYYMQHELDPNDYKKWKKYNDDWAKERGHPDPTYTVWWNNEGRYLENEKQTETDKIMARNPLSDKEQEDLTKKAYDNYDTDFGGEKHPQPKRKTSWIRKIKDALGIE